jgi:DNA-binding transcriptional MerR regulator
LPEGIKDDGTGWRKFTFIEVVWVKILERLREFGFSIEKIAKARDTAMEWDANTDTYPIFEYYVLKAWASKADPYVTFLIDGTAEVLTSIEIEKHKLLYAGYIQYPSWEVERRLGHHKGIISLETFEQNQKRNKREGLGKRIRVDLSKDFPLRGLLVCAECRKHLTAAPSGHPHRRK